MSSPQDIISRMVEAAKAKNPTEMSRITGLGKGSVSAWRARGKVTDAGISDVSEATGVAFEWLKTGKGEMRTNANADPIEEMINEKLNGYTADKEIKDSKLIMHMLEWLAENRPDKFEFLSDSIKAMFITEHK